MQRFDSGVRRAKAALSVSPFDRPFPTDADHDRGVNPYVRGESDPLAELAQLIGQTDPFGTPAKPPLPLQSRAIVRPQYAPAEEEASAPAGPPP